MLEKYYSITRTVQYWNHRFFLYRFWKEEKNYGEITTFITRACKHRCHMIVNKTSYSFTPPLPLREKCIMDF